MAEIRDYSTSPDPQTTDRWPEGMAMSAVNDTGRVDEGILARWYRDTRGDIVSTGSANAYVIAANRSFTAGYDGLEMVFQANFTNTGAATLEITSGVAATQIVSGRGEQLRGREIQENAKVHVIYSTTASAWVLMSSGRQPADIVNLKNYGATGSGEESAAFNAAIAALPTDGGMVLVPEGDYSGTDASLISVGTKYVTWIAYDAILPDAMPGATYVAKPAGHTLELEGTSGRPSDTFDWIDVGSHTVEDNANQQDNILHVQGELADDAGTQDREFRALSFAMKTTHRADNASIRGLRGTVKAIGGSAKLRAIRVTAEGDSGHDGLLTGALVTATRLDGNSGEPYPAGGPGLEESAVFATVGPGIRSVFEAGSFLSGNKERPDIAYRVKGGNQAVLPEVACFDAHGGGNGALFRSRRSDTSTDVIYSVDNQARMMARSVCSGRRTVTVDTAIIIATPQAGNDSGLIEIWTGNTTNSFGKAAYRVATPAMEDIYSGANLDFTTGVLTGTTGTAGRITVSVASDGNIYIENRQAAAREINWLFIASASETGQLS